MEDEIKNTQKDNIQELPEKKQKHSSQIAGAIIIAGVLIAGAILLRGKTTDTSQIKNGVDLSKIEFTPIGAQDHVIGNSKAKVILVEYADFQCPFCGKFFKENEESIINDYVNAGKIKFVYRDYAFLGEESTRASEASWCAGDQGKFWEYHDYLYKYIWDNYYAKGKSGENVGAFSKENLKKFATELGLDKDQFNSCLDSEKYAQVVASSTEGGNKAASNPSDRGTPRTYILKKGKVVDIIAGAQPTETITKQIEDALK